MIVSAYKRGLLLLFAATLFTTSCGGNPIEQPQEEASLTVSPEQASASWDTPALKFTVTSNCDWGVSVGDKSWMSVSPSGGVKGTSEVLVKFEENRTGKDPEGYELAWNEEFETEGKPSMADWWYETGGGGWGNNEEQVYVAGSKDGEDLAFISDGSLKIQARRIGGTVYSIRMNTKRYWQYGWFEARIKVSDVPGSWPAFWMMPQNYKTWPGDGEIDIMEYAISTQGKNKSSSSIHCNAFNWPAGTQKTHVQPVANAATEYHVYALEWTSEFMKFYIDGKLHLTFQNDGKGYDHWPFDAPFYLKFNMAWGGNMGGKTDVNGLPATYEVDYVRVFKKQ